MTGGIGERDLLIYSINSEEVVANANPSFELRFICEWKIGLNNVSSLKLFSDPEMKGTSLRNLALEKSAV